MGDHSDLPFKAEYAKSGRASCKSCRDSIAKDSLRLAIMVQVEIRTKISKKVFLDIDGVHSSWFSDMSLPRVSLPRCFATENGNSLLILHAFRTRSSTLILITFSFTYIFIHEK